MSSHVGTPIGSHIGKPIVGSSVQFQISNITVGVDYYIRYIHMNSGHCAAMLIHPLAAILAHPSETSILSICYVSMIRLESKLISTGNLGLAVPVSHIGTLFSSKYPVHLLCVND